MVRRQAWIALLGGLGLLSLLLLAASLGSLDFREGTFFVGRQAPDPKPPATGAAEAAAEDRPQGWARVVLLLVIWVLLPVSLVMILLDPRALRTVLVRAAVAALWALALLGLARAAGQWQGWFGGGTAAADGDLGAGAAPPGDWPDVQALQLPEWTSWVAGIAVAALLLAAIWGLGRLWARRRPPDSLEAELARAASQAARDLRAGVSVQDSVQRCYQRMGQLLARRQRRAWPSLTPREFETQLAQAGIDDPAINRLSRLFERARYGGRGGARRPDALSADAQEALSCLEGIERRYRS